MDRRQTPEPLDYAPPTGPAVPLYRRVFGALFFAVAIVCVVGAMAVDNDSAKGNGLVVACAFAVAGAIFRFGNFRLF
jgi:hypothetical protein